MTREVRQLRPHAVGLFEAGQYGRRLRLRALTETDWCLLLKWNNDAEVLYFAEGDEVTSRSLEDTQEIYRNVSQTGYCFMIELDSSPIGECWLQPMNIEYLMRKYAGLDCRRIDLMIGEKRYWGQGIGTEAIATMIRFGFDQQHADMLFGVVGDYNERSLRAFARAGMRRTGKQMLPAGGKAAWDVEMSIHRSDFSLRRRAEAGTTESS